MSHVRRAPLWPSTQQLADLPVDPGSVTLGWGESDLEIRVRLEPQNVIWFGNRVFADVSKGSR